MSPQPKGGGRIGFGVDPVGVHSKELCSCALSSEPVDEF